MRSALEGFTNSSVFGCGSLPVISETLLRLSWFRKSVAGRIFREAIVENSGLDWTIARAPRLTQEDSLNYRSREGATPRMAFHAVPQAVAAFMLDAIEQHFHKSVCLPKERSGLPVYRLRERGF